MSLRFITGRAGSGKTTLCLKEINYMQEKGVTDTLIYIVPEQFSLQAERDLIAYGKSGTIMQAHRQLHMLYLQQKLKLLQMTMKLP